MGDNFGGNVRPEETHAQFDLTRVPDNLLWSGVTVRGQSDTGAAIYCHYRLGGRGIGLTADEAKRNWAPNGSIG